MANNVQGAVEFIGQKGKAWNVKINNAWYGHGFKAPSFAKGDYIKFNYTENGNFKNIDVASIEVQKQPTAPAAAPSVTHESKEEAKNYWDSKDKRIAYAGCQEDAVALVALALQYDALSLGTKKNERLGVLTKIVQKVASDLYTHIMSGNFEKSADEEVAVVTVTNEDE